MSTMATMLDLDLDCADESVFVHIIDWGQLLGFLHSL